MTLTPGQKYITIQTSIGPVTIPYVAPAAGDKALFFPDENGGVIAHKYSAPEAGARFISIPTGNGAPIALGIDISGIRVTPWEKRQGAAVTVLTDGSLILAGGRNTSGYLHDVWRSTNGGLTWTQQTAAAGWSARQYHQLVAISGNVMILIGGENSSRLADVWKSDDGGATWTQQTASMECGAMTSFGAVSYSDDTIVIAGGTPYRNDVWKSVDGGATWTQQTAAAGWSGRDWFGMTLLSDDSILVVGGRIFSYSPPYDAFDVWRSTDKGVTWVRQAHDLSMIVSQTRSVAFTDGSVITVGGNSGNHRFVYRSTDQGVTWSYIGDAGDIALYAHCLAVMPDQTVRLLCNDRSYVGGAIVDYSKKIWESDDGGATWTLISQ